MRSRLWVSLLTALIGLTITFWLIRLMPGDVVRTWAMKISAEQGVPYEHAYRLAVTRLNYDPRVPIHEQYLRYLGGVLRGNLGESLYLRVPVTRIIAEALPWTLFVASAALLVSFLAGAGLGLAVTWRRSAFLDTAVTALASVAQSVPDFLVALILLVLFGLTFRLFPLRGAYGVDVEPGLSLAFLADVLRHAVLPVAAFALQGMGTWALATRGSALAVLNSDYLTVARAKGLTDRRIVTRYLGRNAMHPLVTTFALSLGSMFSGAMLVETLFSYPGIGYFLAEALNNRDYTLLQGLFLVTTMATILFTLLADVAVAWLDPRVREGER